MARHIPGIIVAVVASTLLVACGGGGSASGGPEAPREPVVYNYTVPTDVGDGWQTANLADQGFDSQKIFDMMDLVVNENYQGIDSID